MGDIADSIIDSIVDDYHFEHDDIYLGADEICFISYKDLIRETEKAYLVLLENDKEQWYPKKHCHLSKDYKGISVPLWLLKKIEKDSKNEK